MSPRPISFVLALLACSSTSLRTYAAEVSRPIPMVLYPPQASAGSRIESSSNSGGGESLSGHVDIESGKDAFRIQSSTPVAVPKSQMDYPRISHLEKIIAGETYPDEKLIDRISRLEDMTFGVVKSGKDLGLRTDALEEYARTNLDVPTLSEESEARSIAEAEAAFSQPKPRRLSKKVLVIAVLITLVLGVMVLSGGAAAPGLGIGAAHLGGVGAAGGLGAAGMGMAGMGMAMPAIHAGGLGAGMPLLGMGLKALSFGTIGLRVMKPPGGMKRGGGPMPFFGKRRANADMEVKAEIDPSRPTPVAAAATVSLAHSPQPKADAAPPSDSSSSVGSSSDGSNNASLVQKVSWCEMQLFGRTFDSMPMVERLSQISRQLVVDPGASRGPSTDFKSSIDSMLGTIGGYKSSK